MSGQRVEVKGGSGYDFARIRDQSVRAEADINALASKDAKSAAVMIWHYHDDNVSAPDAPISLQINGLTGKTATVQHYRIDNEHSNSYEVWKKMESPKAPSAAQITELEKAGQLQLLSAPQKIKVKDGKATLDFPLPRQGVSLVKLSW